MTRGTTPTLKIKLSGIAASELKSIYITLRQDKREVTKATPDISTSVQENALYVPLTQEDTLCLGRGYAYAQMRGVTKDGLAVASEIQMIAVEEILKEGMIE